MTDNPKPTPFQRLLDALDALTKPQLVAQWQGEGKGRRIFQRTDPPLLDWLLSAVASDASGGHGGGKQARERTPIDVGAFTLYEDIDGRARAWMMEAGGKAGKLLRPTQILRSWYVLWNASNPSDGMRDAYASILESWTERIKDILDPPKKIEITAPCPVCGQEWVNIGLRLPNGQDDPDDLERVRVLNAVERENIYESYAMCRACKRVWKGTGEMRQLRIAIDDAEQAKVTA